MSTGRPRNVTTQEIGQHGLLGSITIIVDHLSLITGCLAHVIRLGVTLDQFGVAEAVFLDQDTKCWPGEEVRI